jgi:Transposase DDE domain
VLDYTVERGNPADAPQLAPAVGRVIARTGRRPRTVTADRGYGEAAVEDQLHDLGVRTVVIPRKGKPGKARQAREHRRAFNIGAERSNAWSSWVRRSGMPGTVSLALTGSHREDVSMQRRCRRRCRGGGCRTRPDDGGPRRRPALTRRNPLCRNAR